ncbi:MAG: hypothetical protein KatS3mg107_0866 [Gemmataceae bacterium]|nr:MAG: hypothetical protein KatS3mg107_0866 [Gemmataceae bacterium]
MARTDEEALDRHGDDDAFEAVVGDGDAFDFAVEEFADVPVTVEAFAGEAFADAAVAAKAFAVEVEAFAVEAFADVAVAVEPFATEVFADESVTVEAFATEAFADAAVTAEAFAVEVEAFADVAVTVEAFATEVAAASVTTQSVADQPGVKTPDFWAANTCRPSCSTTCRNVSRLNSNCAARFKFSAAAAKLALLALSRHTNSRTP